MLQHVYIYTVYILAYSIYSIYIYILAFYVMLEPHDTLRIYVRMYLYIYLS